MPITTVDTDVQNLTMTVVADFSVPLHRLWDAYADPRVIEKFWGPPEWPATFTRHDMATGGRSAYYMTGPDGSRAGGYWEFLSVEPQRSFEVLDGFALPDGSPNPDMPTMRMTMVFEETADGLRMTTTTYFGSAEELEQLLGMGMAEGMRAAMGQIDGVLADLTAFAAGRGTQSQILSDTQVRVSRVIRGTAEQIWAAHHDPALVQRWLLGPDGWTMPVCETATDVGQRYRYEWEDANGENRFGFTGEAVELEAPYRSVTTENMIGADGPGTLNEMTLTPLEEGTLLSLVITYPDAAMRDMILGTGMTDGMERSYARLEEEVLTTV